jgi:anaphase-promoting complex subunit 4
VKQAAEANWGRNESASAFYRSFGLLTAAASGQEPKKGEKRTSVPLGALMRVAPQRPPRMNLLSELLAWPEPPQASSSIQLLTFSPNGKQLAIASADQSIRVVDVNTGNEISRSTKRDRHVHVMRFGALSIGALAFVTMTAVEMTDGARFHAPPAWLIGGIYGLMGAGLGFIVGVMAAFVNMAFRGKS